MDNQKKAIGVFDSGVGGLTVVREIMKQLPKEDIIYFGDTARVPYGTKSKDTIIKFSIENVRFLLKFDVKVIVVACNTASSISLPSLRFHFNVPIIGVIRPGAREAVRVTKNKRVGVIGTKTTIASRAYEDEIKYHDKTIRIMSKACPLFVPLAEEGWIRKKITREIAKTYLTPIKKQKVDTLILGCTHYPLLKGVIKQIMGDGINLVDSAHQTAREVSRLFLEKGLLNTSAGRPRYEFYVSDEPENFINIGKKFLGKSLKHVERVKEDV
ncbi:MAG: glutamate racemase [Candidatus Omnitrophica bacterium]|nr:glutamate racemase [Candidatus Omnitrophota bacterium]